MTAFAYQVRDKRGKKIAGVMEATSEKGVAERLVQQGYLITRIREAPNFPLGIDLFLLTSKISSDDLTMFYFQLANLVDAGIPLIAALETVGDQATHRTLKKIIQNVVSRIQGGASLSEAMSAHAKVFHFLYQNMIRVGETGGKMADTLRHIAQLNEASDELRYQVRSALAYPVVLILSSIAVVVFMLVWIVPTFIDIFNKAGLPLPLPTRLIYVFSLWMKSNPWISAAALIGGPFAFRSMLRFKQVRYFWDQFCLSIPAVGLLIRRIEVAHWSRSLSLMLSSGVPVLQALEISKGLTRNLLVQEVLQDTYVAVQRGGKLADTLGKRSIVPSDVVQLVSTGENSGTLDKMLFKVAGFYDALIARSLKKITSMIEPIFILFMGGIVGFIMLAILIPIFDMIKLFGPH